MALTLDMGNFLVVDEDPVEAVRRLIKYAIMVHVKDFHIRPLKTMPPSGWSAAQNASPTALPSSAMGPSTFPPNCACSKKHITTVIFRWNLRASKNHAKRCKSGLDYLRRELKMTGI